ncbi:hypothetical protein [Rhodopirellula islandica]|uniref:hypothetical protein n=1 Tax=Rhodopirellula islandica TaxID=595434 RepID=UPI001364AD62|nr:hypothetical protein [Rhodopirellula islandica]
MRPGIHRCPTDIDDCDTVPSSRGTVVWILRWRVQRSNPRQFDDELHIVRAHKAATDAPVTTWVVVIAWGGLAEASVNASCFTRVGCFLACIMMVLATILRVPLPVIVSSVDT